ACLQISSDGKLEREFRLSKYNMILRTARLRSTSARDLLTYSVWGMNGVVAADTNGNTLWAYTKGGGIDEVWAADLDGDGFDEVIVGYDSFDGVHVLDRRGKLLWRNRKVA